MNKQIFIEILECALLSFDGVQEFELIEQYGLNPSLAKIGVQLCLFLKSKQINIENETR